MLKNVISLIHCMESLKPDKTEIFGLWNWMEDEYNNSISTF